MGAEVLSLTFSCLSSLTMILWKRVYTHNGMHVECVCMRVCGMYVLVCTYGMWCVCSVV